MTIAAESPIPEPELQQLRRLTEIGRALTYTTSLEQVAQLAVERGAGLVGATSAVLMLPDRNDLLHVRATHGIAPERLARFQLPESDEVMERLQGLLGAPEDRFLAVPLVVGGAVTGLIAVSLAEPVTPADEWLLSALADQVAVALENARLGGEVRLEMEDRLRVSEGATDAKDRALATLAHDIRSPLGAIDGYCWNLEEGMYGTVTDEQRAALGRVRMSGRHLLSLLENVMDMARLNAGVVAVREEAVLLGEVAREAVEMLAPAAAARLQDLRLDELPGVRVTADAARLRQVLVNLLGNAVKFTPEGGRVVVTVRERSLGGVRVGEVEVADTGPGIPVAEQGAIFEPYYRSGATAALPGVGLGLAISHALVAQMRGALAVDSSVGAGASFVVRFPLAVQSTSD